MITIGALHNLDRKLLNSGRELAASRVVCGQAASYSAACGQNVLPGPATQLVTYGASNYRTSDSCTGTTNLLLLLRCVRATLQQAYGHKYCRNAASLHRFLPLLFGRIKTGPAKHR
jgi:hypothetical protein